MEKDIEKLDFEREGGEKKREKILDDFRSEIKDLKEKEEKGELKTVHLKDVNPEELTDEERKLWKIVKEEKYSVEFFKEYKELLDYIRTKEEEISPSRALFWAFAMNKVGEIMLKEYRENKLKEKK